MSNRLAPAVFLLAVACIPATAQPAAHGHRPAQVQDFTPVDSWFSYRTPPRPTGPPRLIPDLSPPAATDIAFGGLAEEILVIGERQHREFALSRPSDELTGLRALDAAQPVVPWPGSTCTYKNLCYDLSQPPLRATLPRLAAALFGD